MSESRVNRELSRNCDAGNGKARFLTVVQSARNMIRIKPCTNVHLFRGSSPLLNFRDALLSHRCISLHTNPHVNKEVRFF